MTFQIRAGRGGAFSRCLLGLGALLLVGGCETSLLNRPDPGEQPTEPERTQVLRLSHDEWERTVADLLRLDEPTGLSKDFPFQAAIGGFIFGAPVTALEIDQVTRNAYRKAARAVASRVAVNDEQIERLAPSTGFATESDRAVAFLEDFLPRALRRPITPDELRKYAGIFEVGARTYQDQPGFTGGLRLVVETVLESPFFLYRIELPAEESLGPVPLDAYQRASRLSYLYWGSMPDDELFEAARSGKLSTPVEAAKQIERMLADPRAQTSVFGFFDGMLDTHRYVRIQPSPDAFPNAPTDLAELAHEETRRFVWDVVFSDEGGVRELLTSTETMANAELGAIYGLEQEIFEGQAGFVRVPLDPSERSGVLTQVGFLASHATSMNPDPIHRGVFVASRISCMLIQAPPANIPPLPSTEGLSNRQIVVAHTEQEGSVCSTCHSAIINPYGFVFEGYDAVGARRTMDGEHEVDEAASPLVDGTPTPVSDAVELARALAESHDVHRCFAQRLVEYAMKRPVEKSEASLVDELAEASLAEEASFRQLFLRVGASPVFLSATTEEEEEQ